MTIVTVVERPAACPRRQLAGEGHRDAAAVRGREQLLGARLAAGIADARREREGQPRERAARRRRACPRRARGSRPSRRARCARCAASAADRDDGGGAVGVVGLGRRARRPEDAEHLHLAGAVVLEAVDEPRRQVDARAGAQRRALAVDVERALAGEDVARPRRSGGSGRARARPGCSRRTASPTRSRSPGCASSVNSRPAVAVPRSPLAITAWLAVAGERLLDEHGEELQAVGRLDLPRRAARDEDAGPRLELLRLAADGRRPRCPRGRRAPRRARRRGCSSPAPSKRSRRCWNSGTVKSGVTGPSVSAGLHAVLHEASLYRCAPLPQLIKAE